MTTVIAEITGGVRDDAIYAEAARIIKRGGLVAFPTETVYGLGADGLNPDAVRKIFEAKGRPQDNPLILHIAEPGDAAAIAKVNSMARRLMDAFWPGPLTLIMNKRACVPDAVSGGLGTVGVRLPGHPAAQRFIRAACVPVAAPSANSSGRPSPTRAAHVMLDLSGKIDMILDGGGAELGLESTIVDVSGTKPALLRPGSVTLEDLRRAAGEIDIDPAVFGQAVEAAKAPGMKYKHYSPEAEVILVTGPALDAARRINELCAAEAGSGRRIGIMATEQTMSMYDVNKYAVLCAGDRGNPATIGANLFLLLRKFDLLGIDLVFAEGVEESSLGLAIMNRLKKASAQTLSSYEARERL